VRISACSIVKNEEHNIARSIESYMDAVDEIIIVDTGSTDNTAEICKRYGAKVLSYTWNNDFSGAKNYALEHAEGDWVVFLDADEWFVPNLSKSNIVDILSKLSPSIDGLLVTMCDFNLEQNKVRMKGVANRIFRGDPKIRYHGCIHEKLRNNEKKINLVKNLEIEIYHSGYANGLSKIKSKRNIEILYDTYNKGKVSIELYFYLFRENCNIGNYEEADKFYLLLMKQKDIDNEVTKRDIFICLYEIMYNSMINRPEKFSQDDIKEYLQAAYIKYPNLPMHSYMIGIEKVKTLEYEEGFHWISQAIALNKNYSEFYINTFVKFNTEAYYRLGYIRQQQGRNDEALEHYLNAIKIANIKELDIILPIVISIIEDQPQHEIIFLLNNFLDIKNKNIIEQILLMLKKTRLHKAFIYYALKYNTEFDGQDETTYIAMILSGQADQVVEIAIQASMQGLLLTNQSNWHREYALIAILYKNSLDLYTRYKNYLKENEQNLIEAYINNIIIINISDELLKLYGDIERKLEFILPEEDYIKFKRIIRIE
jgi:glycosyltransferase involved in cell wall biosynthesis